MEDRGAQAMKGSRSAGRRLWENLASVSIFWQLALDGLHKCVNNKLTSTSLNDGSRRHETTDQSAGSRTPLRGGHSGPPARPRQSNPYSLDPGAHLQSPEDSAGDRLARSGRHVRFLARILARVSHRANYARNKLALCA